MRARQLGLSVLIVLAFAAHSYADSTSLSLNSAPGDYVGGGQSVVYTLGDGLFSARKNFPNGVSVAFNTPTFSHWWYLDFAAPDSQFLTVGLYSGAVRFVSSRRARATLVLVSVPSTNSKNVKKIRWLLAKFGSRATSSRPMSFAAGDFTADTPANGSDSFPSVSRMRIVPGSRSVTRIFPPGRNATHHGTCMLSIRVVTLNGAVA